MYIHIGNNILVRSRDLVGIFDMDTATVSDSTQSFLKTAEERSIVTNCISDIPKSFVVTTENGAERVYISGVATRVLKKRTQRQED